MLLWLRSSVSRVPVQYSALGLGCGAKAVWEALRPLGGLTTYWRVCGGCWVALLPSARMMVISPGKCPQEHGDYPDFVSHPCHCSLCALQVTNLLSEPEGRHMYQAVVNVLGLAYDDLTGEGTHSQLLEEKQCFPCGGGGVACRPYCSPIISK